MTRHGAILTRVARRTSYAALLEREFSELVDGLDLEPERKRFLKSRWLDQVLWMERAAVRAQRSYYALRLVTVVGALLIPALVTLDPANDGLADAVRVATWVVSLLVAISAALEQFFRFGDRWRHYRRTAEQLKTEGWLYLQASGPYAGAAATHDSAYPAFALRVEELARADVDEYLANVAVEAPATKNVGNT